MTDENFGFDTLAIRSGHRRTTELEHSEAIFATSSFVFENAAQAAARFSGDEPGNIYSRFTNPTTQAFEQRLAAMVGGEACVATASGMAAIMSLCVALLQAGDHIVSSRSIFGTTTTLFDKYLPRFGIETSYRQMNEARIRTCTRDPRQRLLFVGIALVLRNVWVWLHFKLAKRKGDENPQLFLELLRFNEMLLWITQVIQRLLRADQRHGIERQAYQRLANLNQ